MIERLVPEGKFLHVIREGEDVVASLHYNSTRNPQAWGRVWSVDEAIARWNESIRISAQHAHRTNHHIVCYEDLAVDPATELVAITEFLGVEFTEHMISDRASAASSVIEPDQPWKAGPTGALRYTPRSTFNRVFDQEMRAYVSRQLDRSPILGTL
jgi:hypothetical protein